MVIQNVEDLNVYKAAFALAMDIFHASREFPAEERYALTGQIRRSARSVAMNLAEAWAKRRYELHFVSKLSDCDGENAETAISLNFASECGYLTSEQYDGFISRNRSIGRMLGSMIRDPKPFLIKRRPRKEQTP